MSTKFCGGCGRRFPVDLLNDMVIGDESGTKTILRCPLCALKLRNDQNQFSTRPFDGPNARRMFNDARIYLRRTGQKIDDFERSIPE